MDRQSKKPANLQRRQAFLAKALRTTNQRVSASAVSETSVPASQRPKRRPTFNDIPRQVTPAENILRVSCLATPTAR